jgi:hypothetical protein
MTYFGGHKCYIKNQYIPQLTEECMALYSSVNQGIYGHVARQGGSHYIPQLHVIEEYIRRLDVTEEYNFMFLHTNKYSDIYSSALYSSVASSVNRGICSSVITDEPFCVSYSDLTFN